MASLFPHDMIVEIVLRLPVKSLLRFRCVSKSWYDLIRSPSFVKMHHKLACESDDKTTVMVKDGGRIQSLSLDNKQVVGVDYPFSSSAHQVRYLGSCNGLVCIKVKIPKNPRFRFGQEIICIWNPSTKEFKELPKPILSDIADNYTYIIPEIYGFGYDSSIQDYKVVQVDCYFNFDRSLISEVQVYSLRSDSWRRIGGMPYAPTYNCLPGTLVNGALHWVVYRTESRNSAKLILSLDLASESYQVVPQPDYSNKKKFDMNVCELEECLCVLCNFKDLRLDVWVMKDYGVKGSWSKMFTIPQHPALNTFHICRPMKIFKNGEILVKNDRLVAFDPKSNAVRELVIHQCDWYDAIAYVGSLSSVNSGTYVGTSGVTQEDSSSEDSSLGDSDRIQAHFHIVTVYDLL